jgi:hypothetical protein
LLTVSTRSFFCRIENESIHQAVMTLPNFPAQSWRWQMVGTSRLGVRSKRGYLPLRHPGEHYNDNAASVVSVRFSKFTLQQQQQDVDN